MTSGDLDAKHPWFHRDYLGSTNFVSDKYASVHSQVEYFPSGEPWFEHRDPEYKLRAPSFLFTGKEYERSTGLYAFGFRHYDPVVGQWISPDPAMAEYFQTDLAGGVFEPRNLGTYAYAWNNPVALRDPTGEFIETALDITSFVMGVASLRKNIKEGKVAAAIVDGAGALIDGAAILSPGKSNLSGSPPRKIVRRRWKSTERMGLWRSICRVCSRVLVMYPKALKMAEERQAWLNEIRKC